MKSYDFSLKENLKREKYEKNPLAAFILLTSLREKMGFILSLNDREQCLILTYSVLY